MYKNPNEYSLNKTGLQNLKTYDNPSSCKITCVCFRMWRFEVQMIAKRHFIWDCIYHTNDVSYSFTGPAVLLQWLHGIEWKKIHID